MQEVYQQFIELMQQLPGWLSGLAVLLIIWGVLLWLFGRRVLRISLVVLAAAVLGIIAFTIGRQFEADMSPWMWVAPAALFGGVMGFLIYRPVMGVLLAVLLGAFGAWAVATWMNMESPELAELIRAEVIEPGVNVAITTDNEQQEASLWAQVQQRWSNIVAGLKLWWGDTPTSIRTAVVLAGLVGLIGGFIGGLIFPDKGAVILTSLLGVVLVLIGLMRLGQGHMPELMSRLPSDPRIWWAVIGIGGLIGMFMQWMRLRPLADKD